MSKKKKLEKENKELRKKVKRYKGLLVDKFGSAKGGNYPPERGGFTPRSAPSVILASEFDGDSLDRFDPFEYDGDSGCTNGCGCDECICTGTCDSSCKGVDTKADENLSPIETLLKHGTHIISRLGMACYTQNRAFNDVNKLGHVNLKLKSVVGKDVRNILSQCPSLQFIFDDAQICGPRPKLNIEFTVYRTFYDKNGELHVGSQLIQVDIPLSDLYCPSHVIKVIFNSVRERVQRFAEANHMYDSHDMQTRIWVNGVADYMLGMFIASCMCKDILNVPDWKAAFNNAFLRDEIYLDNETTEVAVVLQTLYFTTGSTTDNRANDFIVPIIDGKIVSPDELKERPAPKNGTPAASNACEAMGMDTD